MCNYKASIVIIFILLQSYSWLSVTVTWLMILSPKPPNLQIIQLPPVEMLRRWNWIGWVWLFIEHGVLSSLIMDYVRTGTIFLHLVECYLIKGGAGYSNDIITYSIIMHIIHWLAILNCHVNIYPVSLVLTRIFTCFGEKRRVKLNNNMETCWKQMENGKKWKHLGRWGPWWSCNIEGHIFLALRWQQPFPFPFP